MESEEGISTTDQQSYPVEATTVITFEFFNLILRCEACFFTSNQDPKRALIKLPPANPFLADLRGYMIATVVPSLIPDGWTSKGPLALMKFDYCDKCYWVPRRLVRLTLPNDTYETVLETGPEEYFNDLLDSTSLTVCERIGQLALPNFFRFNLPLLSFEDGSELAETPETPTISVCATSSRLVALFSKIPFLTSLLLIMKLLDKLLGVAFAPPINPNDPTTTLADVPPATQKSSLTATPTKRKGGKKEKSSYETTPTRLASKQKIESKQQSYNHKNIALVIIAGVL